MKYAQVGRHFEQLAHDLAFVDYASNWPQIFRATYFLSTAALPKTEYYILLDLCHRTQTAFAGELYMV